MSIDAYVWFVGMSGSWMGLLIHKSNMFFFVHACWGMGIAQLHTLRAVVSDALGIDVHSNVCANFVFGLRYGHALV